MYYLIVIWFFTHAYQLCIIILFRLMMFRAKPYIAVFYRIYDSTLLKNNFYTTNTLRIIIFILFFNQTITVIFHSNKIFPWNKKTIDNIINYMFYFFSKCLDISIPYFLMIVKKILDNTNKQQQYKFEIKLKNFK